MTSQPKALTSDETRENWMRPRLEARLWWCEDEVCNCHQPQIDRLLPNIEVGFPWIKREEVWRGTFESGGADIAKMLKELRAEASARGIALDANDYGVKYE